MDNKQLDLSIIITTHDEGIIAHKTMLCVFDAAEQLKKNHYSYEIIIHIDKGTDATKQYFARYQNASHITILENNFGDPGLSRNFAVKRSIGTNICVLDADDLFSSNVFVESLHAIEQYGNVVVHPEACLTFAEPKYRHVLWLQHDSEGALNDTALLVGVNRWISMCTAPRAAFEKCHYPKSGCGYGNEDWWFNTETEALGYIHKIAPRTIHFYRKKTTSVLSKNNDSGSIQWYSKCFDIQKCRGEYQKSLSAVQPTDKKLDLKRKLYTTYKKIRSTKLNAVITPIARPVRYAVNKIEDLARPRAEQAGIKNAPKFILEEWRKISQIEPQLYPTKLDQKRTKQYHSDENPSVGQAYFRAIQNVAASPDYIFIVPWLVAGGADKVLLNYIRALNEIHPEWKIAVISTTESVQNIWKSKLPENAYFIDFGNVSAGLSDYEKDLLFGRILTQLQCKKLHIINSEYGYRWLSSHKQLIKNSYHLDASLFCHDYIPNTNNQAIFDYADPYLSEIDDLVEYIYTDNKKVIERVVEKYGFDKKKFIVHYQPVDGEFAQPKNTIHRPLKILWASRITYQKCPELLCEIAKNLNPATYQLDVYGRLDGYSEEIFNNIPSLTYRGSYNGFNSIDTSQYDLYLYTSNIDGLPNCLLEATVAGLPIIASDVGGISEFINKETGFLVQNAGTPDAYISAIKEAIKNPSALPTYVASAQKLLQTRHSWSKFVKNVEKDLG